MGPFNARKQPPAGNVSGNLKKSNHFRI